MKTKISIVIGVINFLFMSGQNVVELEPTEDTALVHIKVTDKNGIPEENAKVYIKSLDHSIQKETKTDITGKFDVLLPEGKKYKFIVKKFGQDFIFDKEHQIIDIPQVEGETEVQQDIIISIVTNYSKAFSLNGVNFAPGKWDLDEESKKEINIALINQMNLNPKLKVEIAGHTDNVGDDAHNMKLSQHRANAVRDYVFSKGISHDRVISKGYGETNPTSSNATEEGRKLNRRIEVKVISE